MEYHKKKNNWQRGDLNLCGLYILMYIIYTYNYICILVTSNELRCRVVGYLYHKISVCHDVRKNMNERERPQLLITGLDASFSGEA